jgi:UDP-N-acetylmuramoyl-tripeptide--D-alanyl-D-alanine ligase
MARCLSAVASRINGRLVGTDADFDAVSTDTRTLAPGALFVAISGERFDGNDYVATAAERGAAGALVARAQPVALPQIEVDDTRTAFGCMARAWRRNFAIPVVAVTGSAGKTTVKELIASILATSRKVCVTAGNLNNDIGVPLSLMRLGADDDALVVELGANHAGEIAYLGSLVEPTVAVITNAGAAHLEGFGSIAGVAAAKGELIDALADDGVAVLNADDEYFAEWRQRARGRRVVSFGLGPDADVRPVAEPVVDRESSLFTIALPAGRQVAVRLPLLGRANVANALAAAAAASAAGASNADIAAGLGRARPVKGRMHQLPGPRGSTVIDDTYNANPSAARAALDYLSAQSGRRIAVLGDMLELGEESLALHAAVGEYARGRIDALITVGELAGAAAEAFGPQAQQFASIEPATAAVSALLGPDVTVLVKASRSMGLERLVAAVLATGESGEC